MQLGIHVLFKDFLSGGSNNGRSICIPPRHGTTFVGEVGVGFMLICGRVSSLMAVCWASSLSSFASLTFCSAERHFSVVTVQQQANESSQSSVMCGPRRVS